MIVGTAGHIDHGKTTLVRALTGVDTDRLAQEKARGISIELGYAYQPLDHGEVLGFVDVPGHERLVHTMVAGACGIDFALLVIAADDGVMPQTREHLAILELLGIQRGAIALTKIDRVDERRQSAVKDQIRTELESTTLRDAPLFALDATRPDHPGIVALKQHLHEQAAALSARSSRGLFRLAVDRVFTLAGHGTVVTGTVFSGTVHVGESAAVMPAGRPVRVRGIHAQDRPSEIGRAGQRCALNLAGVDKSAIARGDWIADPRALVASTRIDVRLRSCREAELPLRAWTPLHLHLGTAHRAVHLVPLEDGAAPRAQLVLEQPICAAPGDRFIVRDAQARRTLGGGVVLDPLAPTRKRRSAERLRQLDALERLIAGDGGAALLAEARHGLSLADLVRLTGAPPEALRLPSDAVRLGTGPACVVLLTSHWQALRARVLAALAEFHVRAPDEPGCDAGRLRRIAAPELTAAAWQALLDALLAEGAVRRRGPWLYLPTHVAQLSPEDEALAQRLAPLIAAGGFDPPWIRELAAAVGEPEDRVRAVLRKQVAQGSVCQVVHDLFYPRERIDELAEIAAALAHQHGAAEAARYRDALGIGRKRAIQILEFFDRVGFTRRLGDRHVLRPDSGWQWKAHAPGGAAGPQTQEGAPDAPW